MIMSDPTWYKAELDPELGIDIPAGSWESLMEALEANGLEVHSSVRIIDMYPGRRESWLEMLVEDSVSRKVFGSVHVLDKKYIEFKGEVNK